ncbi:glycosyltransferase [Flavobacteriaceae bacterium]|nr:glycosyltransferase [Flavobacteriaceae bacterium]
MNLKSNKLVSVIIPVYNGIDFINVAIKSIINQDYNFVEIIVVNDGSTDGTKEYLDKLIIKNLVVIHTENKGQSSAINTGFSRANGSIVGYLSADDIYHPKLISTALKDLQKNSEVVCVYPNYNLIDKNGKHIKSILIPDYSKKAMFEDLYCFPGPGAFFYKSHFMILNGWDKRFSQIPDFEFWIRLSKYGEFVKINKELASFRVHESSGSVKKISVRRSNEILILSNNLINEGWDSNKIKSKAYLISSYHHLISKRFYVGIVYALKSVILNPHNLFRIEFYKHVFKGFLN